MGVAGRTTDPQAHAADEPVQASCSPVAHDWQFGGAFPRPQSPSDPFAFQECQAAQECPAAVICYGFVDVRLVEADLDFVRIRTTRIRKGKGS